MNSFFNYNLLSDKHQIFSLILIKSLYVIFHLILYFKYLSVSYPMSYNVGKRSLYMINEDNFAERLTQLREDKQVSAREMSLALGQNCRYINRIENKKAFPSMQCFFYICEYLQITPQEFFDDKSQSPHTLNELMDSLKSLSPKQLDLINNIVNEFQKK